MLWSPKNTHTLFTLYNILPSFKAMCEVMLPRKSALEDLIYPFGIFLGTVPCFLLGTEPALG